MTMAEDPLLDCPLDEVHRIRKSRMQYHLVRCLKNHTLAGKVKCPFNPLHIVEAVEIMHHCRYCPDNASVQLLQFDLEGEKCFSGEITFDELQRQLNAAVPDNNEWEKYTIDAPGYNPQATIESKPVRRMLIGESKAKRKEFRLRERQRHAALEENMAKCKISAPVPEPTKAPKSLRRPHVSSAEPKKAVATSEVKIDKPSIEKSADDGGDRQPKIVKPKPEVKKPEPLQAKESLAPIKNQNVINKLVSTEEKSAATEFKENVAPINNTQVETTLTGDNISPVEVMKKLADLDLIEQKVQREKAMLMKTLMSKVIASPSSSTEAKKPTDPVVNNSSTKTYVSVVKKNEEKKETLNNMNEPSTSKATTGVLPSRSNPKCAANFDQGLVKPGMKADGPIIPQCGRGILHGEMTKKAPRFGIYEQNGCEE